MKCILHPEKDAVIKCSVCGAMVCQDCAPSIGQEESFIIPANVAVEDGPVVEDDAPETAVVYIEDEEAEREERRRRKKLIWTAAKLVLIFLCFGGIIYQVPRIAEVSEPAKPIRRGTYSTDATTDLCITRLWTISKMLQENKPPGNDLVCPASGKPFLVDISETDTIVRSPHPELYGLAEISVSKKYPVPTLIK